MICLTRAFDPKVLLARKHLAQTESGRMAILWRKDFGILFYGYHWRSG